MAADRFLISHINTGLQDNIKPFLIPDDAFAQLNNAYVWRERVRKRFGSKPMNTSKSIDLQPLYTRLRVKVGTTNDDGGGLGHLSGSVTNVTPAIGQLFSIGAEIFTVNALGIPAVMLTTGASTTHTFNTTTGAFVFVGAAALTDVYFYPALPVMGLLTYENADLNSEPTYAFDTRYAYQYTAATGWDRLGTAYWQGTDIQFFWDATVRNLAVDPISHLATLQVLFFVTNFNYADQIKYWYGNETPTPSWHTINPKTADSSGDYTVETCLIIVQFHGRLLFLNTIEKVASTQTSFPQRCRFSQVGDFTSDTAFRTDLKNKGGTIDAATAEAITSAEFLKDRLIVFFESSTWEIVYTGNQAQPFLWQKIDTALGCDATFATVPFDKIVFSVGNVGVHACNGAQVERIDQKIPEKVFQIHNDNDGPMRVYGIRDYHNEMVYWSFPSVDKPDNLYPTRVLVYNYRNGSWSFNDDSITCFGFFKKQAGVTWASLTIPWSQWTEPWGSGDYNANALQILAGNQQGYVFLVDTDLPKNSISLQLTDWVDNTMTIINHNLAAGDYIATALTEFAISAGTTIIFEVQTVVDAHHITVNQVVGDQYLSGIYPGGVSFSLVSRIDILTKDYNFYSSKDRNAQINKVNFLVDLQDTDSTIAVDFTPSTSSDFIEGGILPTSAVITPGMGSLEASEERAWHMLYLASEGATIQLHLYLNDEMMVNPNVAFVDFQMHAIMFYAQPTSQYQF